MSETRPAPGGWRTIDSAPKGKIILLFAVTDRNDAGAITDWKIATGHTPYDGPIEWTWDGYRLREWDIHPTHWQLLPPPPTEAGTEALRATEALDKIYALVPTVGGEVMTRDEWMGLLQLFLEEHGKIAPDETCRALADQLWQKTADMADDDD